MSHGDERPIPANERRLSRAREQGMGPVRRVPVGLCGMLGGALGLAASGLPSTLVLIVRAGLSPDNGLSMSAADGASEVSSLVTSVLSASWPVFAGGVLGVVVGTLAQTGGVITWQRPRMGVGQRLAAMSGPGAWGRAGAGLIWIVAAVGAAALVLVAKWPLLSTLASAPLADSVGAGARLALGAALAAFAALAVLAVVDGVVARIKWRQQLAMTPHEAREEQRANDGDANVRAGRRRAATHANRTLAKSHASAGGTS